MCVIPDDFLFLGSRLGNSLLLRYQEKQSGMVLQPDADRRQPEPPSKRRRVEGLEQLGRYIVRILPNLLAGVGSFHYLKEF